MDKFKELNYLIEIICIDLDTYSNKNDDAIEIVNNNRFKPNYFKLLISEFETNMLYSINRENEIKFLKYYLSKFRFMGSYVEEISSLLYEYRYLENEPILISQFEEIKHSDTVSDLEKFTFNVYAIVQSLFNNIQNYCLTQNINFIEVCKEIDFSVSWIDLTLSSIRSYRKKLKPHEEEEPIPNTGLNQKEVIAYLVYIGIDSFIHKSQKKNSENYTAQILYPILGNMKRATIQRYINETTKDKDMILTKYPRVKHWIDRLTLISLEQDDIKIQNNK